MKHGKNYKNALAQVDREELLLVTEAIEKVKTLAHAKFDETVELAVRLGVDPRKAEQIVRGTISLPAGTGKTNRIAVFAAGEAAQAARDAGADEVGAEDLVAKVAGGFLDFDVAIATPDLMGQVGGLGRVLGPRGLMPNPKTGTVTTDVAKAVGEFKGGRVEYRTDKIGNVQLRVGKVSFSREDLVRNVVAVIDELVRVKPASAKDRYLVSINVSSTMDPGVKIDPTRTHDHDEVLASAEVLTRDPQYTYDVTRTISVPQIF
jgi:large subunit ribosomal protein L1